MESQVKEINQESVEKEEYISEEIATEEVSETEEMMQPGENSDEHEEKEEDNRFHPDATSNEDRKKIMEGYKKSLRNRVFAPLVGGGANINPIDVINAENMEQESFSLDYEDLMSKRMTDLEKKVDNALLMSRISAVIGFMAAVLAVMAATIK